MVHFQTHGPKKVTVENYDPESIMLVMANLSAEIEAPIRTSKEHQQLSLSPPAYTIKIHPPDDLIFTELEVTGSLAVAVIRSHDVLHIETVEFGYIKGKESEKGKIRFYQNNTPLTKPESFFALIETGTKK